MNFKVELVFVPSLGHGHIISSVELTKRLLQRDDHFSATILVTSAASSNHTAQAYFESVTNLVPRIRFTILPQADPPPPGTEFGAPWLSVYIGNHKQLVKDAITKIITESSTSVRLIVDMFSTPMIDVANELGIPSYVYFTSGAGTLGLMLHLKTLESEITTELLEHSDELVLPSYASPIPVLALPSMMLNKKGSAYKWFLYHGSKFKETKGIIVNSVAELESRPLEALKHVIKNVPPVYPVGPVLDLEGSMLTDSNRADGIIKWLDDQPESSVIYLCFGSRGTFGAPQVKEIAMGLEQSGQRFLWSLRRPPSPGELEPPSDYANYEEVLPDGFLDRVNGRGLICGWSPQTEVLGHKAVGGFVSHCGWNSTLESLWFGVPLVTWPLDAEQKLNALQLAKDLGLAVEMREAHKINGEDLVLAEEVERGVRRLIEGDSGELRKKVKEMSEKCRKALMEGGSSWSSFGSLVEDLAKGH